MFPVAVVVVNMWQKKKIRQRMEIENPWQLSLLSFNSALIFRVGSCTSEHGKAARWKREREGVCRMNRNAVGLLGEVEKLVLSS